MAYGRKVASETYALLHVTTDKISRKRLLRSYEIAAIHVTLIEWLPLSFAHKMIMVVNLS
jgi:hypothetical protein